MNRGGDAFKMASIKDTDCLQTMRAFPSASSISWILTLQPARPSLQVQRTLSYNHSRRLQCRTSLRSPSSGYVSSRCIYVSREGIFPANYLQGTGRVGKPIVAELLNGGKHEVTAITRPESDTSFPPDVKVARASYDDHASLVSALRGQQVLIIVIAATAPSDTEAKLIEAAAEADVPYIMPNVWGGDGAHPSFDDCFLGPRYRATHEQIARLGKSSWIAISCGFWYEFSLDQGIDSYGFDIPNRKVRFYDQGTARMNTSTWEQVGRTVTRLLSLKETPDGAGDSGPSLSDYKNKYVYTSSFFISQKDMFASLLRVTGTKESDWDIIYEKSSDRYKIGLEVMKTGDAQRGFCQVLYSRVFYPEDADGDSAGAFEKRHKLINGVLGLPEEDLDERTKIAVEMTRSH